MHAKPIALVVVLIILPSLSPAASAVQAVAPVHHQLSVRFQPASHQIEVSDLVQLAEQLPQDDEGGYRFLLHAGLAPQVDTAGWRLEPLPDPADSEPLSSGSASQAVADVPLETWRLVPSSAVIDGVGGTRREVLLQYGGVINHALAVEGEEYQRSFSETPGLIEERGVFLAGSSSWVPSFGTDLLSFELQVHGLVPPWDVVSQGQRTRHDITADGTRSTTWSCRQPTEEIYLVAGPWQEYRDQAAEVEIFAFLRDADPELAGRYLEATKRYLQLYNSMLPAYPYPSFALVENFWETGYGMPGFTLLGPKVIRFPWILNSSYPHELLHNWWGNSVYVDLEQGNWCEGLTAYLADHLFKEQQGQGTMYRRSTLKKFSDYVSAQRDLPLSDFRSRRSAASEAVGYGKSLMLFHMIRRAVGDEQFLQALSLFFERHRFQRASFPDLAAAFEEVAGGDWQSFVSQWTERTGVPQIEVAGVSARQVASTTYPWQVEVILRQVQEEEPFSLTVPVVITIQGQQEGIQAEVGFCAINRSCTVVVPCPARPLRIDVDPAFDVMRRLDALEVPPALSTMLGAEEPLYVLPATASQEELSAWRSMAAAFAAPAEPQLVLDRELEQLPSRAVWLLGWHNRFAGDLVERLAPHGVRATEAGIVLPEETVPETDRSLVLVARSEHDPAVAVAWVAATPLPAITGLTRKLPHYSRYSYLAFQGPEPECTAKGLWQPLDSPLSRGLISDEPVPLVLPPRQPLAVMSPAGG